MSSTADRVRDLVTPLVAAADASLYDVVHHGATLRVMIDRPGGVDLGTITEVTRSVSAALDQADLVPGAYTLEVSSPGLERPLRTPEHFAAALGGQVRLKLRAGVDGDRRVLGTLRSADETHVTVLDEHGTERTVAIADITKANVHVDWSPPPKPGASGASAGADRTSSTTSEGTS